MSLQVAWIKADNKAIQAIHNRVITNNVRVSVTHTGEHVWRLHISDVQPADRGQYMCQINTAPMRSLVRDLGRMGSFGGKGCM